MEMTLWRQAEDKKIFGQQTPRRWGWGTPLKKRTATRIQSQRYGKTRPLFVNNPTLSNASHLRRKVVKMRTLSIAICDLAKVRKGR